MKKILNTSIRSSIYTSLYSHFISSARLFIGHPTHANTAAYRSIRRVVDNSIRDSVDTVVDDYIYSLTFPKVNK
jgi:hypothetical protein